MKGGQRLPNRQLPQLVKHFFLDAGDPGRAFPRVVAEVPVGHDELVKAKFGVPAELIGHLTGAAGNVFQHLDQVQLGDEITATSRRPGTSSTRA